jgi:Endonuclease-reverse transcriptase
VVDFIANEDEMILITPKELGTRVNPSTGSTSTIDLTMVSSDLALDAEVKVGPYIGSDHLPVHLTLNLLPTRRVERIPRGTFRAEHWHGIPPPYIVGLG